MADGRRRWSTSAVDGRRGPEEEEAAVAEAGKAGPRRASISTMAPHSHEFVNMRVDTCVCRIAAGHGLCANGRRPDCVRVIDSVLQQKLECGEYDFELLPLFRRCVEHWDAEAEQKAQLERSRVPTDDGVEDRRQRLLEICTCREAAKRLKGTPSFMQLRVESLRVVDGVLEHGFAVGAARKWDTGTALRRCLGKLEAEHAAEEAAAELAARQEAEEREERERQRRRVAARKEAEVRYYEVWNARVAGAFAAILEAAEEEMERLAAEVGAEKERRAREEEKVAEEQAREDLARAAAVAAEREARAEAAVAVVAAKAQAEAAKAERMAARAAVEASAAIKRATRRERRKSAGWASSLVGGAARASRRDDQDGGGGSGDARGSGGGGEGEGGGVHVRMTIHNDGEDAAAPTSAEILSQAEERRAMAQRKLEQAIRRKEDAAKIAKAKVDKEASQASAKKKKTAAAAPSAAAGAPSSSTTVSASVSGSRASSEAQGRLERSSRRLSLSAASGKLLSHLPFGKGREATTSDADGGGAVGRLLRSSSSALANLSFDDLEGWCVTLHPPASHAGPQHFVPFAHPPRRARPAVAFPACTLLLPCLPPSSPPLPVPVPVT
jgi:hypothetical protein